MQGPETSHRVRYGVVPAGRLRAGGWGGRCSRAAAVQRLICDVFSRSAGAQAKSAESLMCSGSRKKQTKRRAARSTQPAGPHIDDRVGENARNVAGAPLAAQLVGNIAGEVGHRSRQACPRVWAAAWFYRAAAIEGPSRQREQEGSRAVSMRSASSRRRSSAPLRLPLSCWLVIRFCLLETDQAHQHWLQTILVKRVKRVKGEAGVDTSTGAAVTAPALAAAAGLAAAAALAAALAAAAALAVAAIAAN